MARLARLIVPGAWYHVTARGIERRPIFRNDSDRLHFLELLAELADRFRLRLHAYVLMDNHYHLLLQAPEGNLSRAIQWLNLSHTAWFNRRHRRAGYLFQGRFKSIIVDPVGWGLSLSAYIHLNPVRLARFHLSKTEVARSRQTRIADPGADLIRQRLNVLRTYRWSSYPAYVQPARAPEWLDAESVLKLGGGASKEQPANYRRYVEEKLRQGNVASPWESLHDRIILGGQKFLERLQTSTRAEKSNALPRWARKCVSVDEVIKCIEKVRGQRWIDFRDRHADTGRDLFLVMGRRATNLSLAELAQAAGLNGPAQASMAIKRYETRLRDNAAEKRVAAATAKLLGLDYNAGSSNDK